MNFEDAEIDNCCTPSGKGRILGVIVLTDNRQPRTNDKPSPPDFRCSAFKQTEVDPLQFASGVPNYSHEEDLIAELNRRVQVLEERVEALSKLEGAVSEGGEGERRGLKKKNRRRFRQLVRDHMCEQCQKVYGSDTALKYHLKLKHNINSNHSQAQ